VQSWLLFGVDLPANLGLGVGTVSFMIGVLLSLLLMLIDTLQDRANYVV